MIGAARWLFKSTRAAFAPEAAEAGSAAPPTAALRIAPYLK